MIMTLTDLDNNLKKSINCKKYVYFFHSAASTHVVYTEEAFKNYDEQTQEAWVQTIQRSRSLEVCNTISSL